MYVHVHMKAMFTCMYVYLLDVPKQQTCMKCSYSAIVTSFALLYTVHTYLLLRNFQQNSCSAQPGQHLPLALHCNYYVHVHMKAIFTCMYVYISTVTYVLYILYTCI